MLGSTGFIVQKTCSIAEPTSRSTRCLVHIRVMMAVLVAIHIGIFLIIVVTAVSVSHTVNYYQTYLSGPLSGPSVALTISNGMASVDAVKNITTLASTMAASGALAVGLDETGHVPSHPSRRSMIEITPGNSTEVQDALANLLNSLSEKIHEFNATAPADFLAWTMASNPGPYVREMLNSARYGLASVGTILEAFGSPVDPDIAGPDLIGSSKNRNDPTNVNVRIAG